MFFNSYQKKQKSKSRLPLPTPEESNAMIGDTLWNDSTGAGLDELARSGRDKVNAIRREERQSAFEQDLKALPDYMLATQNGTKPFDQNVANNALKKLPPLTPRTPAEQNAVTGLIMFPESTGAATAPLAQQTLARETAEKKEALYRMQVNERAERTQQFSSTENPTSHSLQASHPSQRQRREARHGKPRAAAHDFRAEFEQDIKNGMVVLPFTQPKPFESTQPNTSPYSLSPRPKRQQWLDNQQDRKNHESNMWPHQPGKLNNSSEAVDYYFDKNAPTDSEGNKLPADLSDKVKNDIIFHNAAIAQYERLKRGTTKSGKGVSINLENRWDTFHVGDTTIQYKEICKDGMCTATFVAPKLKDGEITIPDSFQDPADIGYEIPGGVPYDYMAFEWKFSYPDPHKKT